MKFLADMGISPRLVAELRDKGHDAAHVHERGLGRSTDPEILAAARDEGRILLTHDLDFGKLLAASGGNLPYAPRKCGPPFIYHPCPIC